MGGAEERLGGGRAPVDKQSPTVLVDQAETPHVDGLVRIGRDHPTEAKIETKSPEGPESRGQAMNLEITFEGLLPLSTGCPAFFLEPVRQGADGALEARRDLGKVLLVGRDEVRITLRVESSGQVENTGGESHDRRLSAAEGVLRQAPGREIY